jgi:CubicO group peptidase (beta-lactamase class C family)
MKTLHTSRIFLQLIVFFLAFAFLISGSFSFADNYFDGDSLYLDEVRMIEQPQGSITHLKLTLDEHQQFVLKDLKYFEFDIEKNSQLPVTYSAQSLRLSIPNIDVRLNNQSKDWSAVLKQVPNHQPLAFTLEKALPKVKNSRQIQKLKEQLNSAENINRIKAFQKEYHLPGLAFAVISAKELVWSQGFGLANIKKNIKVTANTPFRLASVSKTFLGVAAMQSVEKGTLQLNTPVNDILPYPVKHPQAQKQAVQFQHLLHHTSGLVDTEAYGCSYYSPTEPELFKDLIKQVAPELICPDGFSTDTSTFLDQYTSSGVPSESAESHFVSIAGERFKYTNIGSGLAAEMIAIANKTTINHFLKKNIFAPLGMVNTGYTTDDFAEFSNVAINYAVDDENLIELPYNTNPTYVDGTLFSSVNDLARYLMALTKNKQNLVVG